MTLNAKTKVGNGSESRNEDVALNAEMDDVMALNSELRSDDGAEYRNRKCDEDGSEHRYWEVITMALNAERRCDDGSERRNWEHKLERQTRKWWWLWSSKPKMRWGWLWTLILRSDNDGSERRTKMWWWLWSPKPRMWQWWLWTPKLKIRLWASI